MQLNNLLLINERQPVNITVHGEKIMAVGSADSPSGAEQVQFRFSGATAIPGLINSHDHLDFNCFPVWGEKIHNNYTEWGRFIHENYKSQIKTIMRIPQTLRSAWGMYKNLLAGVTTVVNHGQFLNIENPLIDIYQEPQNIHSVQFEKNWKWKLNNPVHKTRDCVIHTGEGSDNQSSLEIDKLIKYNLLKRSLIGVHGVAMNVEQAKNFKALVWCPESNKILLNRHAPIGKLKETTRVVFGTDSTLTGNWNIWKHLRLAGSLLEVSNAELFEMITSSPAELWNLNKGKLQPEKDADIVVIKNKKNSTNWSELFKTNPEDILMVIHKGNIRLFDKSLLEQFNTLQVDLFRFSQVSIKGTLKFIEGNLPELISAIQTFYPEAQFPLGVFESMIHPTYD